VVLFDAVTWGRPFASLVAMARFSRLPDLAGFHPKPWFWYGWTVLRWLGPALLLLCLVAWPERRARTPIGLALLSAALLSLSPLKELRYLQICIPLFALAAALGWERLHASGSWWRLLSALALAASLGWGLERTVTLLRGKSQSALEAAQFLHALSPPVRTVALEQMWAYGEKLYLGDAVVIHDVAKRQPLAPETVASGLVGADAAAFYDSDIGPEASRFLAEAGFTPCTRFQRRAAPAVTVYLAPGRPCR
jgi:hypothetical protein